MAAIRSNEVRIDPYDPAWPRSFAAESERLRDALGGRVRTIEHIGSTAVAGMPAKPIVDIAVAVDALDPLSPLVDALVAAGYEFKGEFGLPGRQFFTRADGLTFHVHVVAAGSPHLVDWRDFRDALRADPRRRDAYAALKRDLAVKHANDRPAYTEAKGDFIRGVLAQARRS